MGKGCDSLKISALVSQHRTCMHISTVRGRLPLVWALHLRVHFLSAINHNLTVLLGHTPYSPICAVRPEHVRVIGPDDGNWNLSGGGGRWLEMQIHHGCRCCTLITGAVVILRFARPNETHLESQNVMNFRTVQSEYVLKIISLFVKLKLLSFYLISTMFSFAFFFF